MKHTLSLIVLLMLGGGTLFGQPKAERKAKREKQFAELQTLIQSKQYRFEADKVIPTGFRTVILTSGPNTLDVTDSLAIADLPFFGRAYYVDYGGEGGIQFKGVPDDYDVSYNPKKQRVTVTFSVRGRNDLFRVRLEAFAGNDCSLGITSNNRAHISYHGTIGAIPPNE